MAWRKRRLAAFNKAIEIHGPLSAENLRDIQKTTKRLEREAEAAERTVRKETTDGQ